MASIVSLGVSFGVTVAVAVTTASPESQFLHRYVITNILITASHHEIFQNFTASPCIALG